MSKRCAIRNKNRDLATFAGPHTGNTAPHLYFQMLKVTQRKKDFVYRKPIGRFDLPSDLFGRPELVGRVTLR